MTYSMRDLSFLACTLGAALTTACGDNGGNGSDTDLTSTAPDSSSGTVADPTTTQGPTSEPTTTTTPTTGDTTDEPTTSTTAPTTEPTTGTTSDDTTEGDTTTGAPACPYMPVDGAPAVTLELVADGFDRPVLTLSHPKQPDRLFIVEQGGHIKILEPGMTSAPPDEDDFLYVKVKNENADAIGPEQGLLGFAFHPNFPDDPRVYINYNPQDYPGSGPTYIDEYKLDANDPDKVDPGSRRLVYAVGQPAGNHNGGMISFGADGMLYIGMGDGGGSGDTYDTGRDFKSPHAKILRIDVEPDGEADSNKACGQCPMVDGFDFTVPDDNPFVGDDSYAPEIYALGMRNPWRFTIDSKTDVMYVADVGQNAWEEVSVVAAGGDYGWSDMEGNHCFGGNQCDTSAAPNQANPDGLIAPIAEYSHNENGRCSVTGAGVYRSCEVPAWDGVYFYADYCSSEIFAVKWDGTTATDMGVVATVDGEPVLGSGHNGYGDVYINTVVVTGLNTITDGKVYRIVPGA